MIQRCKVIVITMLFFSNTIFAQKPNVVLIVVDDLGWKDIATNGSSFYETKNIDALAKDGVNFVNAYSTNPVCSPTRASIMTGKYPTRMSTTDWFGAPNPAVAALNKNWKTKPLLPAWYSAYLPIQEQTIAEYLKEQNYITAIAGKWHLGEGEKYQPEKQGFDFNFGGTHKGHPASYFSPYKNEKLTDGPTGEYLGDRLANEAIQFLENNKSNSFFLYFPLYEVHTPLQAKPELIEKYKKKREKLNLKDDTVKQGNAKARAVQSMPTYAAMVETMDDIVGKLMEKLKSLNIYNNTLVIFTSDNGGLSTTEGSPTSNLPLRAGKGWLYEGGIKVPFIIKTPNTNTKAKTATTLINSADILPTVMDYCGVAYPDTLDGTSIKSIVATQKQIDRTLYWHYPHYGNQGGAPASAIRKGDWKLIYQYETETYELYNLKKDKSESKNVIADNTKIANELKTSLNQWLVAQKAQLPIKNERKNFVDTIYLSPVLTELRKKWPKNRPINFVFHGHSVPAGYFSTPNVFPQQSYPMLATNKIQEFYNTATVSCINTATGGENAVRGAARFEKEVLTHNPDVLFIDYALNDRWTPIDTAQMAWEFMINKALERNVKVYLCTPSLDLRENILSENAKLVPYVNMIKALAVKYNIGLIDSYSIFKSLAFDGVDLKPYTTEPHHPSKKGHTLIADLIAKAFGLP